MFVCPIYVQMPPIHLYAIPPVHLYVFPICHGDMGGICNPICFGVFGEHQYICQHFGVCQYIICLSVHISHASCSPSLWVASYWTGCLWMSALLHAVVCFFVVFLMSQASTTIATTTTHPVTVVSSDTSSLLATVTMAPSLMELPATSGQHDVVLLPPLTPRHSGKCCWPCACFTAATSI